MIRVEAWLGWQLSPAELCLLLDFSGEEAFGGIPPLSPAPRELERACESLLEKGLLFSVDGEVLLDETLRGLMGEMAAAPVVLTLDGRGMLLSVYPGERSWVMLFGVGRKAAWRLTAVQTEEEAFEMADAFVREAGGHLRAEADAGGRRLFSCRLGADWENLFPALWARIHVVAWERDDALVPGGKPPEAAEEEMTAAPAKDAAPEPAPARRRNRRRRGAEAKEEKDRADASKGGDHGND